MRVAGEALSEKPNLIPTSTCTVVKVKEADDCFGEEVVDVVSASSSGAGFYLKRKCTVGHLILLMMPLPEDRRSYGHDEELYSVWGLVQHCHAVFIDDEKSYHVGVAFIGKDAPQSYDLNPDQNYRISGMNENGLWEVKETANAFKIRKEVRYWKSINLYLVLIDSQKALLAGEKTVTENISRSGAAVISTLDGNVGDRVKFISEDYNFSGLAVVCNRQLGEDERFRLHLQFVENKFPVESIKLEEM